MLAKSYVSKQHEVPASLISEYATSPAVTHVFLCPAEEMHGYGSSMSNGDMIINEGGVTVQDVLNFVEGEAKEVEEATSMHFDASRRFFCEMELCKGCLSDGLGHGHLSMGAFWSLIHLDEE